MEGKLVRLRGFEKSDLDAVMKWWHDEEVTQFIGGAVFPASTMEEERYIENEAGRAGRDGRRIPALRVQAQRQRSRSGDQTGRAGGREACLTREAWRSIPPTLTFPIPTVT
jgi:hypothetical protein